MADPLTYAAPPAPAAHRRLQLLLTPEVIIGAAAALTLASFAVVWLNAEQEPYYGDIFILAPLIQVGVGSVLIALWAVWCVAITVLVARRRLPALSLAAFAWAAICAFYLIHCVAGYVEDRRAWAAGVPNAAPPPWVTQMMSQSATRPAQRP